MQFYPICVERSNDNMSFGSFKSYYFSVEQVAYLFESVGFQTLDCGYIQRRTVNLKENIDVPRIFIQAKFKKS